MIQTLALDFPVRMLCKLLGVSTTAYYRFCSGKSYQLSEQKADKLEAVNEVFWEHKRRYGSRRITAELQAEGYSIGRHQVRTLMKISALHAIQPRDGRLNDLCRRLPTAVTVKTFVGTCCWDSLCQQATKASILH